MGSSEAGAQVAPLPQLAVGMVLGAVCAPWTDAVWVYGLAAAGLLGAWALGWRAHEVARGPLGSGRAAVVGMMLGVLSVAAHAPSVREAGRVAAPLYHAQGELRGLIEEGPAWTPRAMRYTMRVEAFDAHRLARAVRVRVSVPHDVSGEAARDVARFAAPGDAVRVYGALVPYAPPALPGQLDTARVMARRGFVGRVTAREPVEHDGQHVAATSAWWTLRRALAVRRHRIDSMIRDHLGAEDAHIARAMLLGLRGGLGQEGARWRRPFDDSGTSHILAISGLHMGALGLILYTLCAMFLRRAARVQVITRGVMRIAALPTCFLLGMYVLGIGAPASAVRAWAMMCVWAISIVSFRKLCALHALAAAVVLMLSTHPGAVFEPGAQLSVGATLGIILFTRARPSWMRARPDDIRLTRIRAHLYTTCGVSWSASLGTLPTLITLTARVSLASFWVNLWVVPLVSLLIFPIMLCGVVLMGADAAFGAHILGAATWMIRALRDLLVHITAHPTATIPNITPGRAALCVITVGCALIIARWTARRWLTLGVCLLAVGFGAPTLARWQKTRDEAPLRVHFLPVGQGDATLIEHPDGRTLLIDAGGRVFGPDPGESVVSPYLRRMGVARLDAALVTHPDWDHLGGMFAVARDHTPRRFFFDPDVQHDATTQLLRQLTASGTTLDPVTSPRAWTHAGVSLRLLRPDLAGASKNDRSLTVWLRYGGVSVLLPGDLERAGERWLLDQGVPETTVLKVPHHGSKTSTTPALLARLRPEHAIISAAARSRHGHPHPDVTRRLASAGVTTWETARCGAIVLEITRDGALRVRTTRGALHPRRHPETPRTACGKLGHSLWKTSESALINTR